jgi:hypothetical protein
MNCSECRKHAKKKGGIHDLTVVIDPKERTVQRLCMICLSKFKKATEDSKVAVEIDGNITKLYCYRCDLKTQDAEFFQTHDCNKIKCNIRFVETLPLILKDRGNFN